jgi:hypothetical protein
VLTLFCFAQKNIHGTVLVFGVLAPEEKIIFKTKI